MRPTKMWSGSRLWRVGLANRGRIDHRSLRGINISDWYRMIGGLKIRTIGSVPLKWLLDAQIPPPATGLRDW